MTTTINAELAFTLDDAVAEILSELYGLDLAYDPGFDRYRSIARCVNKALRLNALEHEWSYYSDTASLGAVAAGDIGADLDPLLRPRITGDDAARLVDEVDRIRVWAYFLPRDALHKYAVRDGLWISVRRNELLFSRPITASEAGWDLQVPVMREPAMFVIPPAPEDPSDPLPVLDSSVRNQLLDFAYPDVVTMRAAFLYAQTDPVIQPRVQNLEAQYKDLMYQIIERDDSNTDTPYQNDFIIPVQNGVNGNDGAYTPPFAGGRW